MDTLSLLRAGALAGSNRLDLNCGLTEFPREIFELADSLEILNLSGNRLSELPDDLSRLSKLRILFCSDNDFEHLPAALVDCPKLEMIGFKANRIATVDEAALPEKLRWLILTDNRIAGLPGSIGRCWRLQKLMLAGNRLERLPEEMAACVNLELVRLGANRFREFPQWLFELPRLAWLGLAGNPWSEIAHAEEMDRIGWAELEVGSKLGEGASGIIHTAGWQPENGTAPREVAVKIFKGGMTSDGLPESEMAVCLAAGNHPNLIGVSGKISDHPEQASGLVMPLIGAGYASLAGPPDFDTCTRDVYAADSRFNAADVMRAALELASVGLHLHDRGIVHGDFYAHNILRDAEGHCLLGDFGAASFYPREVDLERIEVRAFGCLLEELLERVNGDMRDLRELQARCLSENVRERPGFAEILGTLQAVNAAAGKAC